MVGNHLSDRQNDLVIAEIELRDGYNRNLYKIFHKAAACSVAARVLFLLVTVKKFHLMPLNVNISGFKEVVSKHFKFRLLYVYYHVPFAFW